MLLDRMNQKILIVKIQAESALFRSRCDSSKGQRNEDLNCVDLDLDLNFHH